ncbi:peptidase M23 [Oceanisphaera profunda]|uniref:Peptidase M23 n=1 Tax=Oceanisphaera profunda TaxID=1416627 RepID=A0A1Y0D1G2_9GAMM|nr:M23 family metallopeptidase [Oceanisphaera profunda]ART81358.1 peptidase M23 [Oceanisphaera profunda]
MRDPHQVADNPHAADAAGANSNKPEQPSTVSKRRLRPWLLLGLLVLLIGALVVRDDWRQTAFNSSERGARYLAFELLGWSPREVFVWRLRMAGLLSSPLGQQWTGAVERANQQPVRVGHRFRTASVFNADQINAHVYQVTLEQGAKLVWQLSRADTAGSRLYASLEQGRSDGQGWSTLTELSADGATASRVVSQTGEYRIVLQPELFGQVEYALAIAQGGSLPFPVASASPRDIGSRFGAPRDGGARAHHGVDIFAKKGTAVIAVTDGRVRTGTGGIGGNHVWLSGGMLGLSGARYYYAHLDSFAIESGDTVNKGDILGYVGNTGNARTTPPHLHFGIYSRGPIDPAPFLKPAPVLSKP